MKRILDKHDSSDSKPFSALKKNFKWPFLSAENAVAYFYCDYKIIASQDPINILGSIARQMLNKTRSVLTRPNFFFVKSHSQLGKKIFHLSSES